ncbi:FAS-associated factor 1 [Maniola hyperantus]|uniref:FAS-associated factor 1 n=1 Tax=Aphantopus hyperantus TaxID=2795564 RepID=UPI00156827AB|nr:FAS-associated factor 1 [Maniola hyperantus]XP_034835339.1 FAS-associated factor 1 [Maniola hyperantus]
MAENREEILANFQGITNIEDVAEAIYHLEETNWDLLSAINRVMPQDGSSSVPQSNDTHDVEMIDDDISVITPKTHPPDREDSNQASTSSPRSNSIDLVELQVHCNNKIHEIKMSGSATVSDLKKRLEMVCGVPVCRQQISGLGGSRATATAALASLGLPRNAVLRLKAADRLMADDEVAERLTTTYMLRVKHDEREYSLKYPGTKTVQEVKNDLYSLTDIPVRHQVWTGWPTVMGLDDTMLAMVGLDLPQHELTVKRAPSKQKEYKRIIVESSDSENSSVEEVEDGDSFPTEDDMFVDAPSERLQPLMSEHVDDEALGCIEFAQRFRARYGPNTPNFFEGTLQDAIKESCLKPARDRKLLGVYLHHEQSVLSNVFCAQLLGCETVLQTLSANFVLYGWDLTDPHNNNLLLTSIASALGPVASMTIRSIPVERLPALIIIMRVRSNTEIYSVINGNVGVSELVGGLVEALERFAAQKEEDAKMERERDARQRVKREQDEAYQRSLEADRAKEEVKKQQELERNQELERAESERLMEAAKNEAMRAGAAARVPAEPAEGAAEVARVRVRLPPPHHECLERRFYAQDTLAALLDYLASKGYPQENYKVIASWPRRDLTMEPPSSTLKALKLYPQETVMLEER